MSENTLKVIYSRGLEYPVDNINGHQKFKNLSSLLCISFTCRGASVEILRNAKIFTLAAFHALLVEFNHFYTKFVV